MFNELLNRYPELKECANDIEQALKTMIDCYKNGGKILLCGNGGSCADCDHIVGELMKGFLKKRPLNEQKKNKMSSLSPTLTDEILEKLQTGLPAISLPSLTALNTAFCNDVDPDMIYAQSVLGLAKPGDVFIGITTSGSAKNVNYAAAVAKGLGMKVVGLTGKTGGLLNSCADICIKVPQTETFKIQELHLPVYHYICAAIEKEFFEC